MNTSYPYRWTWRKWPRDSWHLKLEESRYRGMACKLLCRGVNGNVMLEFVDGYVMVAPGWGLRKRKLAANETQLQLF